MAGQPNFNQRQIVEDPIFTERAEEIEPDAERLDDALRGVMDLISRKPEIFEHVPRLSVRVAITPEFPGLPSLLIYFTIDNEDQCTLKWIGRADRIDDYSIGLGL